MLPRGALGRWRRWPGAGMRAWTLLLGAALLAIVFFALLPGGPSSRAGPSSLLVVTPAKSPLASADRRTAGQREGALRSDAGGEGDCGGHTRVGFLVSAVGRNRRQVTQVLSDLKRFFCANDPCVVPVITLYTNLLGLRMEGVRVIPMRHLSEPLASLAKMEAYTKALAAYKDTDYIVLMDASLTFRTHVCRDVLGKRIATPAPEYLGKPKDAWPLERNIKSTAFVDAGRASAYYAGGLIIAETAEFARIVRTVGQNIKVDTLNSLVVARGDESHWNAYLVENPPTRVLTGDYVRPLRA